MDISKLLTAISDLDNQETNSSINTILQTFVTNINLSQTTKISSNEKSKRFF